MSHTPTPWYATCSPQAGDRTLDNWTIGPKPDDENWRTDSGFEGYGMTRADAEFAAKAVNAHAALVASIKNLVMLCEGEGVWAGHEQARAALALAGEEMP